MSRSASLGLWAKRLAIALVAGLGIGTGTGLVGLKLLAGDAPPVVQPAPEEPETPAPRRVIRGPRADGMRPGSEGGLVGGGLLASRDSVAVVPDLIGRAEGDARRLLERAGFTLGSVQFREDEAQVGTVLETTPPRGARVQLPTSVSIVLADRRRYIDTLSDPYDGNSVFVIPDTSPDTVPGISTVPDTVSGAGPSSMPGLVPDTLPASPPDAPPASRPLLQSAPLPDTLP